MANQPCFIVLAFLHRNVTELYLKPNNHIRLTPVSFNFFPQLFSTSSMILHATVLDILYPSLLLQMWETSYPCLTIIKFNLTPTHKPNPKVTISQSLPHKDTGLGYLRI